MAHEDGESISRSFDEGTCRAAGIMMGTTVSSCSTSRVRPDAWSLLFQNGYFNEI